MSLLIVNINDNVFSFEKIKWILRLCRPFCCYICKSKLSQTYFSFFSTEKLSSSFHDCRDICRHYWMGHEIPVSFASTQYTSDFSDSLTEMMLSDHFRCYNILQILPLTIFRSEMFLLNLLNAMLCKHLQGFTKNYSYQFTFFQINEHKYKN